MPKNYLTRASRNGRAVTLIVVDGNTRQPIRVDVDETSDLVELWGAVATAIGERGGAALKEITPFALNFAAFCAESR